LVGVHWPAIRQILDHRGLMPVRHEVQLNRKWSLSRNDGGDLLVALIQPNLIALD